MDVTERMQAQRLLAWEKNAFELIVSQKTLNKTLAGLVRGLETLSPGMRCCVLLLDDDGIHLRHGAAPSLPADYCRAHRRLRHRHGQRPLRHRRRPRETSHRGGHRARGEMRLLPQPDPQTRPSFLLVHPDLRRPSQNPRSP